MLGLTNLIKKIKILLKLVTVLVIVFIIILFEFGGAYYSLEMFGSLAATGWVIFCTVAILAIFMAISDMKAIDEE